MEPSVLLDCPSNLGGRAFALSYCIPFDNAWLLSLEYLFFSEEQIERVESGGRGEVGISWDEYREGELWSGSVA